MAGNNFREENGAGTSSDAAGSLRFQPGDSVVEWRSSDQVENGTPSTSPPYWETDDDDDSGLRPADLYGKFTWKIENFSKISKRELRSNVFEVGGYKWYILVYPQGCDVCNHLSLFLCVADYDKLLPGWSHFAQFTIAVVNKDPKKSKYSDTLHRFCKKEHDWGWKKFMELSKVLDGFTVADTLTIKAQVQVIRENPHRPFRCLDCQYRRELVRVYLTNVEGICRRFVEEKREKLGKLIEDSVRWSSFRAFWLAVEENVRHRLAREKADVVLKTVVKRFFNEKEVTSTLVMDALYGGCKALDYQSRPKKEKIKGVELDASSPVVWVEKDTFVLADDVLSLLERAVTEPLPPFKDDKGPQNRAKDGSSSDDFGKDSIERDERRLTELGKRTIEMFVLTHLFSNRVEVAYREAIALKRQEELIREEEAAGLAEIELRAKREAAEKEKRSKKKQAKQRRSTRKEKDRGRDEKRDVLVQDKSPQESLGLRKLKECSLKEHSVSNLAISGAAEEDDLSGLENTGNVVGTLGPETEDGDVNRVDWDRDSSEAQAAMEASFSGAVSQPAQCGRIGRQHRAALDDSSSTCSTDSLPSVVVNGSYRGSSLLPYQYQVSPIRGKDRTDNERYDKHGCVPEADNHRYDTGVDLSTAPEPSSSCSAGLDAETVILSLKERVSWLEQRLVEKEEEVVSLRKQLRLQQHQMHLERTNKQFQDKSAKRSYTRDSELSSHLNVDDVNHKSSCMQADDLPIDSSNSISPKELQARHSLSNNLLSESNNCARNNLAMEMSKEQTPSMLLEDSVKSSTLMTIGTELSCPVQCANSSSSFALHQGKNCGLKDSFSSNIDQSLKLSSSGTTEFTDVSRPSSAPLIPIDPRPNAPVVCFQPVPSLARSVSAAGRLGVGVDPMASSGSSLLQSPPVTPSYRNVAAGKMRSSSSSGHVPHPVSSAAETTGSCMQSHFPPSSVVSSCTMSSSPIPSLSKVRVSCAQPFGLMRGDSSSSSVSIASFTSTPQASVLNGHLQEQIEQSGAHMGFTFGTVNPKLLHKQRPQELVLETDGMISQAEERACKQELQQQQIFLGQCLQQQQGELQHQRVYKVRSENDNHDIRFQHVSSDKLAVQGPLRNIDSTSAIRQAGTVLSEEFPHLDIINYLLDEEQNLGKAALSAVLQHPGGQHSNRQLSFPGHHGISSGQLCPEIHLLNSGRFERSVVREDSISQVHCSPDRSSIGLRESMQMFSPYAHSPHAQSYDQHGGIQEGVPTHLWPLCSADLPENNIMNNGDGALNASMGYSMQGNSNSVADCSNFTLGLNGYTVFRPMNQP